MDQYSSQSVKREYLSVELSSFSSATDDGTKKVLDILGKFKTGQTVSQTKVRPYRSNASDNESPGLSLSRDKQEVKSRENSYHRTSTSQRTDDAKSRSTSVRYLDERVTHDDKTKESSYSQTSAYLRNSSVSSTRKPSNSKDTSSSNLCVSRRLSPKKESSGEKRFEMHYTLKESYQVDSSDKSQRNREPSTSTIENDRCEDNTRPFNHKEQLQKRIIELKKEIDKQKSKFIEKSSHLSEVALKAERNKEYSLAASSSSSLHRAAAESLKHERKDYRASHKSLDYRQKASDEKSRNNETVIVIRDIAVKTERCKESSLASLSRAESSRHDNDERASHRSEDYRPKASQEPQNIGSGNVVSHHRQSGDKSRRSRSRSSGPRTEVRDRNVRSPSPRGLSRSRDHRTARSQSRNLERSPINQHHRSKSIERRSHRSRSRSTRSRRSRSHSTRSHRSGSHDGRTGSKSKSLRDCGSKDMLYMKKDGERERENSNVHSLHDQRYNSPVIGKKQFRSRSRSHSPHSKSHHYSVDGSADDSRNAMNKYLSSLHSSSAVRSESQDPLKESSDSRRSPSSVCSFELDWPRSPCQPGTNLRAKSDCMSPMSQLYASVEARMYKDVGVPVNRVQKKTEDRESGILPKDWLLSSILGPRLLVKRDAQRNSVVNIWAERTIDCFEVIRSIGRGAYGQVYKAADKDKNLLVAVKRITASSKHGFPLSAVREMTCLHLLDHPNIIRLLEIIRDTGGKESAETMGMYYYVYEYVAHDLKGIIECKLVKLSSDDISGIMIQLLNAVDYCHSHSLVHRNIKSSNILINYRGELKLTQFGMSRILHNTSLKDRPCTPTVTNLWYRSPELLLGSDLYETTVDMWGCGCVLGEMFLEKPLFPGRDELHQLHLISILCGSPSATVWPDVSLLPLYYTIQSRPHHPRRLREEFCFLPVASLDLLDTLLTLDPKKRSTAAEALRMDCMRDISLHKLPPIHLPKTVDCHCLSEESKSESKSDHVTIGTKRRLSPDAVQNARPMKRQDLGELGLSAQRKGLVERDAVEALQPRPLVEARCSSVQTSESSSTDRSIHEMPASLKPKLLNLRVMDYQHQTVVSPSSKADSLQQENDQEQQRFLPQRQSDDKLTYYRTEDQSSERQLRTSVNKVIGFQGSDFSADRGLSYKELAPVRPGLQTAIRVSSTVASASTLKSSSSDRVDPGLPESGVAFWNAMKVYCANFDGSKSKVATVGNQMASEMPFQPVTSSLYTETGNLMKKPNVYSGHPYSDTMYSGRIRHHPVELDTDNRKMPPGSFSFDKRDDGFSIVHRPRLSMPPSRNEARYGQKGPMPSCSLDVDSRLQGYATGDAKPYFPSVISKVDTNVESSASSTTSIPLARVQYIAPRPAEKLIPYTETPSLVQSVRTDDNKPPLDPPASGTILTAASGDGPSTLQGLESTNTRPKPKLMGILKNRIEVKADTNIEWKTLQPKQ